MASLTTVRAFAPAYGREATHTDTAYSSGSYFPIRVHVPCEPSSSRIFGLVGADIAMAALSFLSVCTAVLLAALAMRTVWRLRVVRDVSLAEPSALVSLEWNASQPSERGSFCGALTRFDESPFEDDESSGASASETDDASA